jgi:hypothetical protein
MQHTSACDDCIVTAVLGLGEAPLELDDVEQVALGNLADAGLVAPLRLVPRVDFGDERRAAGGRRRA